MGIHKTFFTFFFVIIGAVSSLMALSPDAIVASSWDVNANSGSIRIDISKVKSIVGPYHYFIGKHEIPQLTEVYQNLKDSIGIDSVSFFTGNNVNQTQQYDGLDNGRYFVAVFDSKGTSILSESVLVQEPLIVDEGSDLSVDGQEISSANQDATGTFKLYATNGKNLSFNFAITNSTEQQFIGLSEFGAAITDQEDLEYGFYFDGADLYTISQSITSTVPVNASLDQNYRIEITEGQLTLMADAVSLVTVAMPQSFVYQLAAGIQPNSALILTLEGKSLGVNHNLFSNITQYLTCNGGGAEFNFGYVAWGNLVGAVAHYTVTNTSTDQVLYATGPGGTTLSQVFNAATTGTAIEAGLYEISGTLTNGTVTEAFTTKLYVGYEAAWGNVANYTLDPNNYSLLKTAGSIGFGTAGGGNILLGNQNGWIEFTPKTVVDIAQTVPTNFMRINDQNLGVTLPTGTEDWVYFGKFGNEVAMLYYINQNFNTVIIPLNARVRIDIENGLVNISANGIQVVSLASNSQNRMIRCVSDQENEGFENVVTSFSCAPPISLSELGYFQLKRQIDGGFVNTASGILRFSYTEEYNSTGNLNYSVYNVLNRFAPVQDGSQVAVPIQHGDNRYDLDVSGIGQGTFILEVENEKQEKWYLRFKN